MATVDYIVAIRLPAQDYGRQRGALPVRQCDPFPSPAHRGLWQWSTERLHMAQPPLSAAVRQLEQQLGVALLDRSSRQVRLTAAGEQMLERGRDLLAHADSVVPDVQAVERSPSGLLPCGLSPAARFDLVPDLLERWSTAAG